MAINVAHVVRQYLPSIGGMEEVVRNIARAQLASQRVKIITLDRLFRNRSEPLPAREFIDGIEVIRLPFRGSSRYPLCPQILGELDKVDLVHVHGVDFFYDFLAATRWLHRKPLLLSTHGGFFHTSFASRAKLAYFNTITRLSARAYNRVVATSSNDGTLFEPILGRNKLEVIENGVDIEKFAAAGARTRQPCLIYFGRWSANKGLEQTLRDFRQLHRKHPEWRLILAGREYDLTRPMLEQQVANLGLAGAVQLETNPDNERLRGLIAQASYFVCLSRHEGFGIAPIEAMSAGLIPLLSAIPPFQRLADESGLGVIASPASPLQLNIPTLLALHQQGDDRYQEQRAAAIAFSQRYAWPAIARRYMNLYEEVGLCGSHPQKS